MGLTVQLLGPPRFERDGRAIEAPRGHKAWGLLAYLVSARVPPSRERLASLLFPEADDPLGRCAGRSRLSGEASANRPSSGAIPFG